MLTGLELPPENFCTNVRKTLIIIDTTNCELSARSGKEGLAKLNIEFKDCLETVLDFVLGAEGFVMALSEPHCRCVGGLFENDKEISPTLPPVFNGHGRLTGPLADIQQGALLYEGVVHLDVLNIGLHYFLQSAVRAHGEGGHDAYSAAAR